MVLKSTQYSIKVHALGSDWPVKLCEIKYTHLVLALFRLCYKKVSELIGSSTVETPNLSIVDKNGFTDVHVLHELKFENSDN